MEKRKNIGIFQEFFPFVSANFMISNKMGHIIDDFLFNTTFFHNLNKDFGTVERMSLFEFIEGAFSPNRMISIYDGYYELLKEHAYAEVSAYTFLRNDAEFDAAVEVLKDHVQARHEAVVIYLEK